MTDWIQTNSGRQFYYTTDKEILITQIDLDDIAHALAHQRRFLGHSSKPISVLQHSLAVGALAPGKFKLEALLHDAAEAYTGDIPTPLKLFLGEDFFELERAIDETIRYAFGLPSVMSPAVKVLDEIVLFYEKELAFDDVLDWGWKPRGCAKHEVIKQYYTSEWTPLHFKNQVMSCM